MGRGGGERKKGKKIAKKNYRMKEKIRSRLASTAISSFTKINKRFEDDEW